MYDSANASEVRLIDGPGTASGTPLFSSITALPGSVAQEGTDATGVIAPAGAIGIRGWLSGVYNRLANIASLTLTGGNLNVNIASGATTAPSATTTAAVAVAAAAAAIKATAGRLYALVVTTSGAAQTTLTDGASGTIIAVIPANQPIGELPLFAGAGRPFSTSLYANTGAGSPAFTAIYS